DLGQALDTRRRLGGVDDVDEDERCLERAITAVHDDVDRVVAGSIERHDLPRRLRGEPVVEAAGHEDQTTLEELFMHPTRGGRHIATIYPDRRFGNATSEILRLTGVFVTVPALLSSAVVGTARR